MTAFIKTACVHLTGANSNLSIFKKIGLAGLVFFAGWGCCCFAHAQKHEEDVNIKNNAGETPLHQAVKWGDLNRVKALIEAGADVNVKNSRGANPLLLAIAANNPAMVKELVENGADPNMKFTFTWDLYNKDFEGWYIDGDRLMTDQNKVMSPLDLVLFIRFRTRYIYHVEDVEAALREAGAKEFHKPLRFPHCRAAFAYLFNRFKRA